MQNSFSISILPWFKVSFNKKDDEIEIVSTNRFFIFPAGKTKEIIPIRDISSCRLSTYYDSNAIICGIVLIILGTLAALYMSNPLAKNLLLAACIIIGGIGVISGIGARFFIEKKGMASSFYVPVYSRGAARETLAAIEQLIGQ